MSPVHQIWLKPSFNARWKGEENKADRGRGGTTTSGNGETGVPKDPQGSGEQGKMKKTGCKIICGAQTTLAVKGLMRRRQLLIYSTWQNGTTEWSISIRSTAKKKERERDCSRQDNYTAILSSSLMVTALFNSMEKYFSFVVNTFECAGISCTDLP